MPNKAETQSSFQKSSGTMNLALPKLTKNHSIAISKAVATPTKTMGTSQRPLLNNGHTPCIKAPVSPKRKIEYPNPTSFTPVTAIWEESQIKPIGKAKPSIIGNETVSEQVKKIVWTSKILTPKGLRRDAKNPSNINAIPIKEIRLSVNIKRDKCIVSNFQQEAYLYLRMTFG
ncbi:MAG: hypothetical protein HRU47_07095 [Verrucomicrobiales bacterium]|nr:hypothetical protein [Verrucomicrobiales bacterium]